MSILGQQDIKNRIIEDLSYMLIEKPENNVLLLQEILPSFNVNGYI